MALSRNIPWPRILAEGATIVVSILLALWADAWWDERQSQVEEQIVLQALLEELRSLQEAHLNDVKAAIAIRNSVLQLLRATVDLTTTSDATLDRLLSDVTWSNSKTTYAPPVLMSLAENSNLSLISDPKLRLKLSRLAARLSDIEAVVGRDQSFLFDRTIPFLSSHASLLQILNAVVCKPGVPDDCWDYGDRIELSEKATDHSEILKNREFQGMLSQRLLTISDMLEFGFEGLDAELHDTIENLEHEL